MSTLTATRPLTIRTRITTATAIAVKAWHLTRTRVHLPDGTTHVKCDRCRQFVKARHYNPRLRMCEPCGHKRAAAARYDLFLRQARTTR